MSAEMFKINNSLTDVYAKAWSDMGISKDTQIQRIKDWANMLEERLSELDVNYKAHSFGRLDISTKEKSINTGLIS